MWKKTLFAATLGGFAMTPRAAEPETAPPPSKSDDGPQKLDTVIVTGQTQDEGLKAEEQTSGKMPMTLRETPQSVTVITRDSLDDRQVTNLQQALELAAGVVQYSGTGPFGGQPSFGFNSTTIRGIQIDDVYDFRDDGFVSGSFFATPDLLIYDHVEVVKGPNSVLYGRGSVGGLVNRVRKKPLAEDRLEVGLSAGSFDTYRADVDVTGPMFTKAVRGRLVAGYEDARSFVRGPHNERLVLAPSLDVDLTPTTRLLLMGTYQHDDIVPNTGVPLRVTGDPDNPEYLAPHVRRRQYLGLPTKDAYTWKIETAIAQLEQTIDDHWLATLRLSSSNISTPIRTDAYVYQYGGLTGDGNVGILGNDFAIDRDVWSAELQVNGQFELFGREAKVGFGADHNDNQYSRRGAYTEALQGNIYTRTFTRPDPATLTPGFATEAEPTASGFYAQTQLHPMDRLAILLGARYDEVHLNSVPFHAAAGDVPAREKEKRHKATGRIGATWEFTQQVSTYAMYAQSFQPDVFGTDRDGKLLKQETGEIYEVGLKTEWLDRRLGANFAAYRVNRKNIPETSDDDPTDDIPPFSVSSGLQRSDGFEIEINGRPLPGWDVSFAYNLLHSQYKDPRDALFGAQPGGAADWQVGAYTSYEVQNGPAKGLGFGGMMFLIDDRGVGFQRGTIPGYERVDLYAFYKGIKNVELNLGVRNIFDRRYIETADRPSAIAQFGSPTAVLLSMRYVVAGR